MFEVRREELSKLKFEDYDESTQSTKISGKKKKERPNFLTGNVLVAFDDWITVRGNTSGPSFYPINKGNNMLRVGITPPDASILPGFHSAGSVKKTHLREGPSFSVK